MNRAALAAAVLLAAALRFTALDRQGLLLFDEGRLVLEARAVAGLGAGWRAVRRAGPDAAGPAREALARTVRGCPILFGKPVHNALLAAGLAGGARADRATLLLSAAAGTLTVALAGWLAARWYGPLVGWLAALTLAVSPYHLLYSRGGLADALTACLLCAAFAAWEGGLAGAAWSGAFAGAAAGANYRVLFVPAVFLVLAAARPETRRNRAARAAAWIAGFLLPLAAAEAAYRGCAAAAGTAFPLGTYAGQLRTLLALHGGQGFTGRGWAAFPWYVQRWEGSVALAVLAAAAVAQLARWRGPGLAVNLWWGVPWLLFSAYWDNAPRFFLLALPPLAIARGRMLVAAAAAAPARFRGPAHALAVAAALAAAVDLPAVVPRPAPAAAAIAWLAATGRPAALSTNPQVFEAAFGPGAAAPIPATPARARAAARAGCRWAVTDLQGLFGGFDRPEDRLATAGWLASHCPEVFAVPYPPRALEQGVLEQDLSFADARTLLAELETRAPRLRIFDLAPLTGGR